MAKVKGGITGRPAGKVASLIFGAARGREGKVVTVRELVAPSNPRTPEQQAQRGKFQSSLAYVQGWGPDVYQSDWNRSVGQLPGFQSMMSILLNNIQGTPERLTPPDDRQLGSLHFPDSFSASITPGNEVSASWSTEQGPNGSPDDVAVLLLANPVTSNLDDGPTLAETTAVRSDAGIVSASLDWDAATNNTIVGLYFRGAGPADGLLSVAKWLEATE